MEKEKNLTQPEEKKSLFFKFIHGIEVVGNKLPQPFYLFSILIVVAIILSVIFAGATATYEKASSAGGAVEMVEVTIKNLLNKDTITYVTQNMYSIYYNFSPMMMMGLLMLSIGLCETTGFFGAFIKRTIGKAKPAVVFAVVAFGHQRQHRLQRRYSGRYRRGRLCVRRHGLQPVVRYSVGLRRR